MNDTNTLTGGVQISDAQVTARDIIGRDQIIGFSAEQVSAVIAQIRSDFAPKPFDGRSPYVGLDAFTEDDADRFFGREALVAELIARIKDARFVVIAGPSGSGKSSLVRAGVLHALKQAALPGSDQWRYETLTPGRAPLDALARATASLAGTLSAADDIRSKGAANPTVLHEWAEIALRDHPNRRALIFVDQFEEIFTQVASEAERVAFLNLLTHAATAETGHVTLLFAIRSDFVANCARYPQLNQLINQQFFQVGAMEPAQLVSAIARPALQVGLHIDPDLITQLVNDMRDEPGALPLMQFTLKDLFDAKQAQGQLVALTLDDYLARGGIHKSLERHADLALAKLSDAEQQLARLIFTRLIQMGQGTQDTRRTVLFGELLPAGADAASIEAVVRKLADARLLTVDETGDERTVMIAHEKLIDAWPWLRKLANENREAIILQNQIAEDAREWEQHARDASYLYTGARLATTREQVAAQKLALGTLAQAFVQASAKAERRERKRQQEQIASQAEREQLRYLRQAFGGAISTALGYGLAFALPNLLAGADSNVPLVFLSVSPLGALIGFCLGLCLWRWHDDTARRFAATTLVGALAGAVLYALYARLLQYSALEPAYFLVGGALGASLGVGAGVPLRRRARLLLMTLLGFVAMEWVAVQYWITGGDLISAGVMGVLLGGVSGLGFYVADPATRRRKDEARLPSRPSED